MSFLSPGFTIHRSLNMVLGDLGAPAADPLFQYVRLQMAPTAGFPDQSSNNAAPTASGVTSPSANPPPGTQPLSASFGGAGYIDYAVGGGYVLGGSGRGICIELWYYTTVASSGKAFDDSDSSNLGNSVNFSGASTIQTTLRAGGAIQANPTRAVIVNSWTHLAMNVDAQIAANSAIHAYENGVKYFDGSMAGSGPFNHGPIATVGNWSASVGHIGGFNGQLAGVRVTDASRYPNGTTFVPPSLPLNTY